MAVTAGFLAVSLVVAGTAAAMAGAPADAAVAAAVELSQEDPTSLTPAIEADRDAAVPVIIAAPVEVRPHAIECDAAGLCSGSPSIATGTSAGTDVGAQDRGVATPGTTTQVSSPPGRDRGPVREQQREHRRQEQERAPRGDTDHRFAGDRQHQRDAGDDRPGHGRGR